VDLGAIVKELESKISAIRHPPNAGTGFTIAVMGCEVNGPGEAKEADIGIAFGKDSGMLFRSGKAFKKVAAKNAVDELIKLLITHY
jgi:(E)-4-hydroxy-3-methylbut-2-enyl-diphosphate synthase